MYKPSLILTDKNYIEINVDVDVTSILKILNSVHVVDTVVSCNENVINSISKVLKNELPLHSILYFEIPFKFKGIIHMDSNLDDTTKFMPRFALNIPLQNCDKVKMTWYKKKTEDILHTVFQGPSGTKTPTISGKKVTYKDSIYYTKSHLVKIDDWHSVENEADDSNAKFISVRFNAIPYSMVYKKFNFKSAYHKEKNT